MKPWIAAATVVFVGLACLLTLVPFGNSKSENGLPRKLYIHAKDESDCNSKGVDLVRSGSSTLTEVAEYCQAKFLWGRYCKADERRLDAAELKNVLVAFNTDDGFRYLAVTNHTKLHLTGALVVFHLADRSQSAEQLGLFVPPGSMDRSTETFPANSSPELAWVTGCDSFDNA